MIDAIQEALESSDYELREQQLQSTVARLTNLDGEALRIATRTTEAVIVVGLGDQMLHARPGGWVLRLGDATARAGLATAVTAGVMAVAGFDQLPALVLPAVLPLLIDLDHVELSPGDRHVLATLRLQPDVVDTRNSPQELYDALPVDLREQVSILDFLDLIERLRDAGQADTPDGVVIVRNEADPAWLRFRLT